MEDCNICYDKKKDFFVPSCDHKMCLDCYNKLIRNDCPYCRKKYTYQELQQKQNIYSLPDFRNNNEHIRNESSYNNYNSVESILSRIELLENENIRDIPYASIFRNMKRRRRRNLSFEEIKERRKIIRKRQKRKWIKKTSRMIKC